MFEADDDKNKNKVLNYMDKDGNFYILGEFDSSISENVESSKWETIKLNTIPNQGTETVRTEEAVISTLAIFNIL